LTDTLVIGGETLRKSQFEYLIEKDFGVEIVNEYGPTEATIGCISYRFNPFNFSSDKETVLIGEPFENVQILILDEHRKLQANGLIGEIFHLRLSIGERIFE
jgi:non-ribosomal peptide synthetase component F